MGIMWKLILVIILAYHGWFVSVHSKTPSDTCGRPRVPMIEWNGRIGGGARIVGGPQARIGSHPWIVSLRIKGHHFCGGSLIRVSEEDETDVVVTAAHCVFNRKTKAPLHGNATIKVVVGAHFLNGPKMENEIKISVIYMIWHEGYALGGETDTDDIAILILDKPIKFKKFRQPVCLPGPGERVKVGTNLTVAGWGHTDVVNNSASNVLLQVTVPVMNDEQCESIYKWSMMDLMMVCAGGYAQGGLDPCQGDSGGPAVAKQGKSYVMHGLVSFGYGCAEPGIPTVYNRVSSYVCWIFEQVRLYSVVYNRDEDSGDRGFWSGVSDCGPNPKIEVPPVARLYSHFITCNNTKQFTCYVR